MQKKYKNFEVEVWSKHSGSSENLVLVSAYIVKSPKIYSLFVFGDGLLARMNNPDVTEQEIDVEQFEMIKEKIDSNDIENFGEYVFQYYGHNYLEEDSTNWWNKTLKDQARKLGFLH